MNKVAGQSLNLKMWPLDKNIGQTLETENETAITQQHSRPLAIDFFFNKVSQHIFSLVANVQKLSKCWHTHGCQIASRPWKK